MTLEARLRRTAWILAAVIVALGAGAACFIAKNGWKSRTVLHSELRYFDSRGDASWT